MQKAVPDYGNDVTGKTENWTFYCWQIKDFRVSAFEIGVLE